MPRKEGYQEAQVKAVVATLIAAMIFIYIALVVHYYATH